MTTVTFDTICNNVTDIRECIADDSVKVIPLKPRKKNPRDNGYYTREYSITDLENHRGNFGIIAGYNHQESSLAIIDIDGYTMDNVTEDVKQYYKKATADYLYECLKDIKGAMFVETQSGGHHIYLWNQTVHNHIHETSNRLHFPSDFYISELAGKSLKHSIEIFTKEGSKQCLLPGCIVYNKQKDTENGYTILNGVDSFSNIGTVKDIHQTVIDTLLKHNFTYEETAETTTDNEKIVETSENRLKQLSRTEVKKVSELVTPLMQRCDGAKHNFTLYLGGYLCRNVTKQSTKSIANSIIKKIGSIFENKNEFKKTLLISYNREDVHRGGMGKLCSLISEYDPTVNVDKFRFEMNQICKLHFRHSILVKKYSDFKKKYIDIDYHNHKISTHIWNFQVGRDEKGNQTTNIFHTDTYDLLNMSPEAIYETYNILDKNASPKLCLSFYREGMPSRQVIEGTDISAVEKQLEKRAGIVLKPREFKGILNEIIKEYVKLEQIHTVEEISVQGVFVNPLTNNLVRAGQDKAIRIELPSVDSVNQALSIWEDLEDVYPGSNKKLAHILKWGLISPFSYILKTDYTWHPLLFLYGASRTSKTTLAEISLSPYTRITEDISIGGGAFDTPYRIGEALSRQGIGVIINEPSASIEGQQNVDIIKRAVESSYSREKQIDGVHTRIPAYANMCFTSNSFIPTNDAFVRRADYLEFTKSERLTDDDIKKFTKKFHHQNWNNTRFLELKGIGDFTVNYVAENLNVLGENHEVIINTFLDELFGYVGSKTPKWLKQSAELMDVGSTDNEILSDFRRMVLKDYRDLTRNSNKIYESAHSIGEATLDGAVDYSADLEFKMLFITLLKNSIIDYLYYQNISGQDMIIVNTSVKNALKDYCGLQVTCKGLADYMNCEYGTIKYKGNSIKGFRMSYDDFKRFLNGGEVT